MLKINDLTLFKTSKPRQVYFITHHERLADLNKYLYSNRQLHPLHPCWSYECKTINNIVVFQKIFHYHLVRNTLNMVNMSNAVTQHLGRFFTRLCVPIPMFHIFSEVVGVLNVAVAKCKIVFPAILPDTVSTMQAIHEEKCTALIGAPIILS